MRSVLLTEQLAELIEDVNPGLAALLKQEGGAPGSVGQRGQARHEVSSRLLRLLELLGPGVGGDQEDGSDHQPGKVLVMLISQYLTISPGDHSHYLLGISSLGL